MIPFKKKAYLIIVLINFPVSLFSQTLNNVRIGIGIGESIYWGTQMDNNISTNIFGVSEINPGYSFQTFFAFDKKQEIGIRYLTTELWSFKLDNKMAFNAKVDEYTLVYQRSLNNNIDFKSRANFTYNLVLGAGILYYRSVFYIVDPNSGELKPFSSVGKRAIDVSSGLRVIQQIPSISGLIGFNVGYKISEKFSLYFENSFTLSASNKITGNLLLRSEIPANGYTFNSLSLYYNFGSRYSQLNCPKF
jgi:hypothetical protein